MSDDPALMALTWALARYRDPTIDLPADTPLPPGVTRLLQVASGSVPGELPLALSSDADELRAAARQYIEQVLLSPHSSHYRVLGLEPPADPDRLKRHQRLLLRLFHPDRRRGDLSADQQARRINQAYQVLSDPARRRRYDAELTPAAETVERPRRPAPDPGPRQATSTPRLRWPRVNPRVARLMPGLIMTELGLLAVLFLWGLYLLQPAGDGAEGAMAPVAGPEADRLPGLIGFGDPGRILEADGAQAASLTCVEEDTGRYLGLVAFELTDTLARFVAAFERGEMATLMGLFEVPTREALALGQSYQALFENTSHRVLIISDLHWEIGCEHAHGQGRYLLRWRQTGHEQRAAGWLWLSLGRSAGEPRLTALRIDS